MSLGCREELDLDKADLRFENCHGKKHSKMVKFQNFLSFSPESDLVFIVNAWTKITSVEFTNR